MRLVGVLGWADGRVLARGAERGARALGLRPPRQARVVGPRSTARMQGPRGAWPSSIPTHELDDRAVVLLKVIDHGLRNSGKTGRYMGSSPSFAGPDDTGANFGHGRPRIGRIALGGPRCHPGRFPPVGGKMAGQPLAAIGPLDRIGRDRSHVDCAPRGIGLNPLPMMSLGRGRQDNGDTQCS